MRLRLLLAGGGTGGHLQPALNLAAALRRRADREPRILYVGAERGLEARVLPRRDLPYRLLPMHPIHRSRPWRNWRLLASAPAVWAGLRSAYRDLEPHAVVGTGGYASGPPVLYGLLAGAATALQEQNAAPGLVTRWMAPRVDQVHLGFPEARSRVAPGPETRVFSHGNPVDLAPPPDGRPAWWPSGRVVLVVGGSQGARGLNGRLLGDLTAAERWPADDVRVVWISGPAHEERVRESVAETAWADRFRVAPYVERLAGLLGDVELAVSRAGAMFVSELTAAGVPSVLVPFPAAAGGHQAENARRLAEAGAAETWSEDRLEPGQLWARVTAIMEDDERRAAMAEAARERGAPEAADRIADDLLRLAARAAGSASSVLAPGGAGSPGGDDAGDG